ncbi:MAG: RagB/SusD family nutrient uptake outer membrane protein [Gemmatimonadota bacterium]
MRDMNQYTTHARAGLLGTIAVLTALTTGCDVTNPGPIQDAFLADEEAQIGLIFGAQRSIATQYASDAFDFSLVGREMFPGGQTGAWGAPVPIHAGHIQRDYDNGSFDNMHEARFIGETAIARFTEAGASDLRMHQAHLWTAWAYRILGEWWCDTVLPSTDPSATEPPEWIPGTTDPYFDRAVSNFTAALGFASSAAERHAALAGRAQAHLWLGNWGEAFADAQQVTDEASEDFAVLIEQSGGESALYNHLFESSSGVFRSYTVQFTFFHDYYADTGDPRTPWYIDPEFDVAVGSLTGYGQVPYLPQGKFLSRDDDINIASWAEMKLIQAEAILRGAGGGDIGDAMTLINEVRTRNVSDIDETPLDAYPAPANAAEAWTFLMQERGIELWLEGRRFADERRWTALDTPGDLQLPQWENDMPAGSFTTLFTDFERGPLCFGIPNSERDRNPNVPQVSN